MHKNLYRSLLLFSLLFSAATGMLHAQLIKDLGRQIEVPQISNLQSSATHLYVLSESEGLVVFRTLPDSLQWLYSSTGMQQRGHTLESDIRFAYLYGDTRRLTIIEPTSVLGVYSSTVLPDVPQSVERIGNDLYIALGNSGFGKISLATPESVDAGFQTINESTAIDVASDGGQTLFVLNSGNVITIYTIREGQISQTEEVEITRKLTRIFLVDGELMGSDNDGNLYLVDSDGDTEKLANVSKPVDRIETWNNRTIVRTTNGDIWIENSNRSFDKWKSGERAGNYFTISEDTFWLAEFDKVVPIDEQHSQTSQTMGTSSSGSFKLSTIKNITLPYPRPLLLPIEFESEVNHKEVSISYNASFNNAEIRGSTFYWQPNSNQTGRHSVTITASLADGWADSTTFVINLRPFNSPPRFTPSRPISIPAGENFSLKINAIDPDGINQSLIRYLGVDMPSGAHINEQTGRFTWEPTDRQVGEHSFRVIATDQYGAAASQNYTITVKELSAQTGDNEDVFEQ